MKAIVIDGAGGPEVLKIKEMPDPKAGEGEVVIKIVAAALNRADVMQRQGNYPPPAGASLIPGLECSGTVESVGHGVTHWKVGDEVRSFASHSLNCVLKEWSLPNSNVCYLGRRSCFVKILGLEGLSSELLAVSSIRFIT